MSVAVSLPTASAENYLARMQEIPGWFGGDDAKAFLTILEMQGRAGVRGDLLEIGSFWGRSAILLGHATSADEVLTVCDIFEQVPTATVAEELSALVEFRQPSRDDFEQSYQKFLPRLPEIVQGDSSELGEVVGGRAFRFVHIDGSHVYSCVRADLTLAAGLLVAGGVIAADDYANPNFPGVCGAVWESVWSGQLVPIFATTSKLYLTLPGTDPALVSDIRGELAGHFRDVREHDIAGMTVTVGRRAWLTQELLGRRTRRQRATGSLRRRSALVRSALTP